MTVPKEILDRVFYKSLHRGTREMDLMFSAFCKESIGSFDLEEIALYEEILDTDDAEIGDILLSEVSNADNKVLAKLKEFIKNKRFM